MARTPHSALWLLVGLVFFPDTECWERPSFCRNSECPMFTVVKNYGEFEERNYNTSSWITTDVPSTSESDLKDGFWRLYYFHDGQNSEGKSMSIARPVLVSVKEADSTGKRQVTISIFQPDPNIPDPTDTTIRKTVRPGGNYYVRWFGGYASDADALENAESLKTDVKAAGKKFIENQFDAAGYDAPLEFLNRHNEVWVQAA